MRVNRRQLLLATCALGAQAALSACGQKTGQTVVPAEFNVASTCDLDGMLLADYPGPKAQIHFAGESRPTWYCDTAEMFSTLLKPEQVRTVLGVFVQDMELADWDRPRGYWFDARTGTYVLGSRRRGSMGPTIASFRQEAAARKFATSFGGQVMRFAEVKPEMVDLSGGALHDSRM
ncbi:Nitrous oxide reductase accessory protein NosL (plasmid) [Cupriavidus necator H16]|uniref:Nitrous oxide reductase accessory protein NosL n=1 Tax=Cupriavidus necator (strain ATCC 17699 / DSM 428 / KCTC 22496 / NCIMB 10442 / H16 / Stanier 337) TaxID=381666 RepID=Q7WX94_CUPNH|nr:nitrous oxide reductase accessory protein NosL [Cupriavidus necator]AAP85996.1 putative lipoprotein [Cupriavidus necator H16]QCC05481.1 nitrous oxide reductase accessory protein NosL [Cupriavidus necator H16]QQB81301.1 nitrous oxide reductase accessory protein NosL [Cupriavidus necator]